ncbi:MAG: hypothetical protein QXO69_02075 [archaeon]
MRRTKPRGRIPRGMNVMYENSFSNPSERLARDIEIVQKNQHIIPLKMRPPSWRALDRDAFLAKVAKTQPKIIETETLNDLLAISGGHKSPKLIEMMKSRGINLNAKLLKLPESQRAFLYAELEGRMKNPEQKVALLMALGFEKKKSYY